MKPKTNITIPKEIQQQFQKQIQQMTESIPKEREAAYQHFQNSIHNPQFLISLQTSLSSIDVSIFQIPSYRIEEEISKYEQLIPLIHWLKEAYSNTTLIDYGEDYLSYLRQTTETLTDLEETIQSRFLEIMDLICLGFDYAILRHLETKENSKIRQILQNHHYTKMQTMFYTFEDQNKILDLHNITTMKTYYQLAKWYCNTYLLLL